MTNDGVALVGSALGGTAPLVRLTPLGTQSEKDEQSGFQDLIRGMYRCLRNPRTHKKTRFDTSDTEDDAVRWVFTIDTVLRRLQGQIVDYDVNEALRLFTEPGFVETHAYSDALVDTFPVSHHLAISEAWEGEATSQSGG